MDLGVASADIVISQSLVDDLNATQEGKEVLATWNTFAMMYGGGVMTGLVLKNGQKFYQSARNYLRKKSNPELQEIVNKLEEKEASFKNLPEEVGGTGVAGVGLLKKVVLGSEELSQFAINFRKTLTVPNHRGNVAVFEYLDNSGNLVKKAFTTEINNALHSEEIAIDFFNTQNIPKQNIKRIFSELEPCSLEDHMCKSNLSINYPSAEVKYSYDYPGGNNATQEMIDIRRNSVNSRAIDLDKLLK